MTTAHLALPYIEAAQAQKEVTHNEALNRLDALVQLAVLDRDLTAPPADPAEGDRYIVATGATDAWGGHDGEVAAWYGGWIFLAPRPGWRAWVADEAVMLLYGGAGWDIDPGSVGALFHARDVKGQWDGGGSFEAGDWRRRDLNTVAAAQPWASLAANQVTLAPGRYVVQAAAPAYRVNEHVARLYDVTGQAVLLTGTAERSHASYYTTTRSMIAGVIALPAGATVEVQHQCATTNADEGFGRRNGITDNVYTELMIWRLGAL